jgi:hypothetical protein
MGSLRDELKKVRDRKIWAHVSEADWYRFCDRVRKEGGGADMGEALALLVHLYANGATLSVPTPLVKELAEKRSAGVDYVKESQKKA